MSDGQTERHSNRVTVVEKNLLAAAATHSTVHTASI